jgi:hypothetical protein
MPNGREFAKKQTHVTDNFQRISLYSLYMVDEPSCPYTVVYFIFYIMKCKIVLTSYNYQVSSRARRGVTPRNGPLLSRTVQDPHVGKVRRNQRHNETLPTVEPPSFKRQKLRRPNGLSLGIQI